MHDVVSTLLFQSRTMAAFAIVGGCFFATNLLAFVEFTEVFAGCFVL